MGKDAIINALLGLFNERVTWLNLGAITVSLVDCETILKILIYIVSIIASILVSRKYLLEIKKLKKEQNEKTSL